MSAVKCNYQSKVTAEELSSALSETQCHQCGVSVVELMLGGQLLEVCGEEFGSDIETGERVVTPIALCPSCHRKYHLDAGDQHNPCQIAARLSWERMD